MPEDLHTKYLPAYSDGAQPLFEDTREGFRLTLPLSLLTEKNKNAPQVTGELTPPVNPPVTPPVTPPVAVMQLVRLIASNGPLGNAEILAHRGMNDRTHLREHYIDPALEDGLIERTIPDKPNSRLQKYRLTNKGKTLLAQLKKEEEKP